MQQNSKCRNEHDRETPAEPPKHADLLNGGVCEFKYRRHPFNSQALCEVLTVNPVTDKPPDRRKRTGSRNTDKGTIAEIS